jgi:hypothetical protein
VRIPWGAVLLLYSFGVLASPTDSAGQRILAQARRNAGWLVRKGWRRPA